MGLRGNGETVLLIHGLGGSGADWDPQISALEGRFRVVVPDLPGCGLSAPPERGYSIAGIASVRWALLDHLENPRINIIGFSLGGAVALEMALQRPTDVPRRRPNCGVRPYCTLSSARWAHFVERSTAETRLLEVDRMRQTLAGGTSLLIFPEGTFSPVTGLRPFQLGAFEIAVSAGVPIIPLTLGGTRLILRDGQHLPRRLPAAAVIGEPLGVPTAQSEFAAAVRLRDAARACILQRCGESELL